MRKEVNNAAGHREKSLWLHFRESWRWILAGAVLSFVFASILLVGWPQGLLPHIKYPYLFKADSLYIQWLAQRVMEGSVFSNDRSGFPFGSTLYDYPGADAGSFLIFKILGLLTHSSAAIIDLYFLLSFPVTFAVTFCVARAFDLRVWYAAAFALVFTFVPFHFVRYFWGHDFYTWYFGIPLFFYYGRKLFLFGRTHQDLMRPMNLVGAAITVACLSSFGVYYAFFGMIVLCVCGLLGAASQKSYKPLVSTVWLCAAIGFGFVLNVLPNILFFLTHGRDVEVAARSPIETELYGLKLINLLLPAPDHRIASAGAFTQHYEQTFPLSNGTSYIGILGDVGLLMLLVAVGLSLIGRKLQTTVALCAAIVVSLLLIATVGGFNDLFALFVSPLIRGWDRVSIFIAFAALMGLFATLNESLWTGEARRTRRGVIVASCLAVIGLWDQTPTTYSHQVKNEFRDAEIDKSFIGKIENSLPKGMAIYQLPYVSFPESPDVHGLNDNQLLTGFFHSRDLRWSFGGMRGREGDLFYRALAKEPAEKQVQVLEKLGFAGVYIDLRGYENGDIVAAFTKAIGAPPVMIREDGKVAFFKLQDTSAPPPNGMSADAIMKRAGFYADRFGSRSNATMADGIDFSASAQLPAFVKDISGLSVPEPWGTWSDAAVAPDVRVMMTAPLPDRFTLDIKGNAFGPNVGKDLVIVIGTDRTSVKLTDQFEVKIPFNLHGQSVSEIRMISPSPTTPASISGGSDTRKLGIGLRTLKIQTPLDSPT